MKELNQKLAQIQTKFKSKKSRYNSFGKYYFRSAEDILEATKPFLLDLGVSVTLTEEVIPGYNVPIIQSTAIISDCENQITATAVVGVDLLQKGMQMPQSNGVSWNFHKFIVSREVKPIAHFSSDIEPENLKLIQRIELELDICQ